MLTMVKEKLQRTSTGLDVGATGVRAVQIKKACKQAGLGKQDSARGPRYVVTKAIKHEWQGTEPESDAPEAGAGADAERLRRMARFVRSAQLRKQGVVVELNPPAVECHPLDLPPAAVENQQTNVSELVKWEIQRLLGDEGESVETRHWTLPRTKVPSPTVMGVAARSQAVASIVSLCDASGLYCQSVEPASLALARFGDALNDWGSDQVWGILDLGATETRLILCVDGVPTVVRRAGVGGQAWTSQIAESLEVGIKAAEIQKREQGISSVRRDAPVTAVPGREVASILLGALRNQLLSVASEVKRSYEYALSCYPGREAGDLVLVGGGAAMKNLPEFLSDALDLRVARASEYVDAKGCRLAFDVGRLEAVEEFAVAIGLGIAS